ncbi:MAG: glycosyltransferase family 4 protein [Syntrophobacteraceae bacterium]
MMPEPVCLVTNIPAPYRIPVFDRLSGLLSENGRGLTVVYKSVSERGRLWKIAEMAHSHLFLSGSDNGSEASRRGGGASVGAALSAMRARTVISCGYDAVMLRAFVWARRHRVPHITFTEGTLRSERSFGPMRRLVRRLVIRGSAACIGGSRKSIDLLVRYGADPTACFRSCLCVDNDRYVRAAAEKEYDLLYLAHFIPRKMPDLITGIMQVLGKGFSLLVVGDGPQRSDFLGALDCNQVDYHYTGFVQPQELPAIIARCRLLLFPTRTDTWGIVANEGCAAGLPVLTTPEAGAAGELIVHGRNGYILPPRADVWADCIRTLLYDPGLYTAMSRSAREMATPYNIDAAANGIQSAILHALRGKHQERAGR